jgi:hypothetical protein
MHPYCAHKSNNQMMITSAKNDKNDIKYLLCCSSHKFWLNKQQDLVWSTIEFPNKNGSKDKNPVVISELPKPQLSNACQSSKPSPNSITFIDTPESADKRYGSHKKRKRYYMRIY